MWMYSLQYDSKRGRMLFFFFFFFFFTKTSSFEFDYRRVQKIGSEILMNNIWMSQSKFPSAYLTVTRSRTSLIEMMMMIIMGSSMLISVYSSESIILGTFLWVKVIMLAFLNNYNRLSFSRPRLSRITAYLEAKIWSLFKHENLTTGNKILWKRGEIAPKEQFLLFSTIYSIYL